MTPKALLALGRVSNLPTVVSNVLAGAVLNGAELRATPLLLTTLAGGSFYVGGMALNDAFDAEIDARERPERPIPSGRATRRAVFLLGFALLGAGLVVLVLTGAGLHLLLSGLGTASAVVFYDRFHKGIAWSPVVMGLCRAGLYLMGASAVSRAFEPSVLFGALVLLLYVVGLTHVARFETASSVGRLWPTAFLLLPLLAAALTRRDGVVALFGALFAGWTLRGIVLAARGGRSIGRAVVSLIAGISLADALVAAAHASYALSAGCVAAWALTLGLQRWVRGT